MLVSFMREPKIIDRKARYSTKPDELSLEVENFRLNANWSDRSVFSFGTLTTQEVQSETRCSSISKTKTNRNIRNLK